MDKEEFNQRMNVEFIFKIERLSSDLAQIYENFQELAAKLDEFKEECLSKIDFKK